MPITLLGLKNYGGFEALELPLNPALTVLVGRNGSGKTTILKAVTQIRNIGQFSAKDVRIGLDQGLVNFETERGSATVRLSSDGNRMNVGQVHDLDFILFYRVGRGVVDQTPGSSPGAAWSHENAQEGWSDASANYARLFAWIREMEDLENERIRYQEGREHPQLEIVRQAVASFFPGFSLLRVRRNFPPYSSQPVLTVKKGSIVLTFDMLSEGERSAIAMVADIARRLTLYSLRDQLPAPLEAKGTILIDEIEQHLHPGWQRHFLRQLPKTFPNIQFVVTTQSPIIVSEVSESSLRVLRDFNLVETGHHLGRDANSVLEETFETTARPEEAERRLEGVAQLIDERKLEEAADAVQSLESDLGQTDPDVVYYRTILDRLLSHDE